MRKISIFRGALCWVGRFIWPFCTHCDLNQGFNWQIVFGRNSCSGNDGENLVEMTIHWNGRTITHCCKAVQREWISCWALGRKEQELLLQSKLDRSWSHAHHGGEFLWNESHSRLACGLILHQQSGADFSQTMSKLTTGRSASFKNS